MHVRSLSVQERWPRIEDTIPFVREVIEPTVEGLDGALGVCMLVDQRKPQCIVLSGWESEQTMHASDASVAPVRQEAERRLGGGATVELWEVAALRRPRPIHAGSWVSVARLRVAATSMDAVVEAYRRTVLTATTAGVRAALLLVHRAEHRAVSAVVFDSYPALRAASAHARPHDLHAVGPEADVHEIGEYEVEIAGTRLPESV